MVQTQPQIHVALTRGKNAVSAIGERWIEKYFYTYYHHFVYCKVIWIFAIVEGMLVWKVMLNAEIHYFEGRGRVVPIVRKFPGFAHLAFC
jgi:hypothetical protein